MYLLVACGVGRLKVSWRIKALPRQLLRRPLSKAATALCRRAVPEGWLVKRDGTPVLDKLARPVYVSFPGSIGFDVASRSDWDTQRANIIRYHTQNMEYQTQVFFPKLSKR